MSADDCCCCCCSFARIPQTIHFIWVGPYCGASELPARHANTLEQWIRLNPGWKVQLWTHSDFRLGPESHWSTLPYAARQQVPALCADALRFEILAKHGGYYFDMDFRPLLPMDTFVHRHCTTVREGELDRRIDTLVCHEEDMKSDPLNCSIGFVACVPGAATVVRMVNRIATHFLVKLDPRLPASQQCGVQVWRSVVDAHADQVKSIPSRVFYPYGWRDKFASLRVVDPAADGNQALDDELVLKYANHDTIAVHLWDASWWSNDLHFSAHVKRKYMSPCDGKSCDSSESPSLT